MGSILFVSDLIQDQNGLGLREDTDFMISSRWSLSSLWVSDRTVLLSFLYFKMSSSLLVFLLFLEAIRFFLIIDKVSSENHVFFLLLALKVHLGMQLSPIVNQTSLKFDQQSSIESDWKQQSQGILLSRSLNSSKLAFLKL